MTMGSVAQLQQQRGGFDFSLHERNVLLLKKAEDLQTAARGSLQDPSGSAADFWNVIYDEDRPRLRKTGTTICGVLFNGGVVLGADTRATQGHLIADKNCSKLHKIHDKIFAAGAGTSADLDHTTHWLAVQVELHRLNTRSKGHIGCAVVMGGVDAMGAHLYSIHPMGSTDKSGYVAMGSGSLSAMGVLEAGYKNDLTEDEAISLVVNAIAAGVKNDLGSGGAVDICVITGIGHRHHRSYYNPTREAEKTSFPPFPRNTTPVFSQKEELHAKLSFPLQVEDVVEMQED